MRKRNVGMMTLCAAGLIALCSGCGEPVPQNKLALVVSGLGERSVTNQAASTEIVWARRLPWTIRFQPGTRVYMFPRGLQDYSFTKKQSYESPNDESIQVDCLGGHITMDVNIQMYLDDSTNHLSERLLQFLNDYQLQSYAGDNDMLARWAGEKLLQFVRAPIAQYTLNKQAIEVMRSKSEIDRILIGSLRDRFGKYGLVFTSAGIISHIELPADQKARMNAIVQQEYANLALEMREKQFMPLTNEIVNVEQAGLSFCQDEKNRGTAESIAIMAEAQRLRRKQFIDLVGEPNYVSLEAMLTMVKNLQAGKTKIVVVPKSVAYINIEGQHATTK